MAPHFNPDGLYWSDRGSTESDSGWSSRSSKSIQPHPTPLSLNSSALARVYSLTHSANIFWVPTTCQHAAGCWECKGERLPTLKELTSAFLVGRVYLREGARGGVRVDRTIIVLRCRKWCRRGEHGGGCGNTTKGSAHTASVLSSYPPVSQILLRKSRSYSFWPTPLPSLNSSSSYQHYSFLVIHWLMSFLVLLLVKFFFITLCIRWQFFSTGLCDCRGYPLNSRQL